MPDRTPLILVILKLPFQLIQLILYFFGLFTYLPIYLYCLIFSKFLFSPSFETSQTYYILLCLPRAIISLGAFIIGAGELFAIYWAITQFITFDSLVPLIITVVAVLIFTIFSFRFGYKLLFDIFKFPRLKSVKDHLTLVWYGVEDIISAFFTIFTVCLLSRTKKVFEYNFESDDRKYLGYSFKLFMLTVFDILSLPFWAIVFIFHWRFPHTRRTFKELESEEKKYLFIIGQGLNAVFDLPFIPIFVIDMLNPFLKARRLLSHMNKLSVTTWRRLIFNELLSTLFDLLAMICFIFSCITVYQIPLSFTLYKKTLEKTTPFDFSEDEAALNRIDDDDAQKELSVKVCDYNEKNDNEYRNLYFVLLSVAILDIFLLIFNILFRITVYKYFVFQKKIQALKLADAEKDHPEPDQTFTYGEYRTYIYRVISMDETLDEDASTYSTYPGLVLYEALLFLLDLPVIILSLLLILAPWRLLQVLRTCKREWENLEKPNEDSSNTSLRYDALICIILIFADYICLVIFVVCLLAFWRWKYTFSELWTIIKTDLQTLNIREQISYEIKFDFFDHFVAHLFLGILIDLLFTPLFAVFALFYIICFWRIPLAAKCLRTYDVSKFNKHRLLILWVGCICFVDFLKLFPLIFTFITIIRISTFCSMLGVPKKDHNIPAQRKRRRSELEIGMLEQEETQSFVPAEITLQIQGNAPPQVTASSIIEKERKIECLDAGVQCSWIVILDIFSVVFFISIYTRASAEKKYSDRINELNIQKKDAKNIEKYAEIERSKVYARYKYGFPVFLSHVGAFALLFILWLLLWRLPTLFILIKRTELRDAFIDQENESEAEREHLRRNKLKRFSFLIFSCLLELLKDLLYLPLFVLLIIFPWRMWPVIKQVYQYNLETKLIDQFSQQRDLVFEQLLKGIGDLLAFIEFSIIVVTLFRIPFLFMIIVKNRFPNSSLSRKSSTAHVQQENINLERQLETKLPLKSCIWIAFKEFVKDLPFVFLGIIVTVLAVWRIFTLYFIFRSQTDRIPTHDIQAKSLKITSRRREVGSLFITVFTVDYLNLLKILVLVVTIYRIPIILYILVRSLFNLKRYQTGELSLKREIDSEYNKAANALRRLVYSLIILVLIQRIPSTIKRLLAYRKVYEQRRQELKYKQGKAGEGKEEILSLNDISWDVYGRMLQYLDIKDLTRMSQVNKKFYALSQKDYYWEYQFKRDWATYEGLKETTYKEKCITAYKHSLVFREQQPLPQEKVDSLYGTVYILYDEMIKSISWLPNILLIPAKLIALVLWWTVGFCIHKQGFPLWVPLWGRRFIDLLREEILSRPTNTENSLPTYEETKNYKRMHEGLITWIIFIVMRYIYHVGFILSYIGCTFIGLFNAGQTARMQVEVEEAAVGPNRVRTTFVTNRNGLELQIISNRFLRYLFYLAQFIFTLANIAFFAASLAVFPFLFVYYLGWEWYEAVFGPCFILLVHYAAILNAIITECWYLSRAAKFFSPYKALTEPIELLTYIVIQSWEHVGKPVCESIWNGLKLLFEGLKIVGKCVFEVIKSICKGIWQVLEWIYKGLKAVVLFIYDIIKSICKFLWEGIKLIFRGIKAVVLFIYNIFKSIFSGYVEILAAATRLSLKWGTVGDIILIPVVLIWMLWPLIIPIALNEKIYFIPTGLISVILLFVGYKTIQKASKEHEE